MDMDIREEPSASCGDNGVQAAGRSRSRRGRGARTSARPGSRPTPTVIAPTAKARVRFIRRCTTILAFSGGALARTARPSVRSWRRPADATSSRGGRGGQDVRRDLANGTHVLNAAHSGQNRHPPERRPSVRVAALRRSGPRHAARAGSVTRSIIRPDSRSGPLNTSVSAARCLSTHNRHARATMNRQPTPPVERGNFCCCR